MDTVAKIAVSGNQTHPSNTGHRARIGTHEKRDVTESHDGICRREAARLFKTEEQEGQECRDRPSSGGRSLTLEALAKPLVAWASRP